MNKIKFKKIGISQLVVKAIIQIIAVMLIMQLCRALLYMFNKSLFLTAKYEVLSILKAGFLFDSSIVFLFNSIFFILFFIPFQFVFNKKYQNFTNWFFVVTNSLLILINLIDVIYYRFIGKRTTSEFYQFLSNNNENRTGLLSQFIIDYWYIALIWLALSFLLFKLVFALKMKANNVNIKYLWYIKQFATLILALFITIIVFRGGFQLKPISMVSASKYVMPQNISLALNTPFTIVKSLGNNGLTNYNFYSKEELDSLYTPIKCGFKNNRFIELNKLENYNVVILIIESFGAEYIGYFNNRQYSLTPFLDSLLNKSIVFDGYANGKRSIEALPSIFAGIPSLMDNDFPTSPFINNNIEGIGTLLKRHGYATLFFHGGNNGTMFFDAFSKKAGLDQYFGRKEYNNDSDFNGVWGINDEPFLQFTIEKLKNCNKPFLASIFTLSSHHPYVFPDKYKNKFRAANNKMEETMCYTDLSLKHFFATISKCDWFNNTIFVITADHSPEKAIKENFSIPPDIYKVPIAYFINNKTNNLKSNAVTQHIDITPSLLALLNIKDTIVAFGNNVFDTTCNTLIINYLNNTFHCFDSKFYLSFNNNSVVEFYNLTEDLVKSNNIANKKYNIEQKTLEIYAKLKIQSYVNRMNNNMLVYGRPDKK